MSIKDSIRESDAASMPLSSLENQDIKDVSSSHYEEKTEVIYGEENVVKFAMQQLSTVNKTLELCGDRYGPSIIIANEPVMQMYIELHNKGVRQRHIVEITKENIADCKKLMKFQELRHLDGLKGYLSILDGKVLGSHAFGLEHGLPHAVASTVKVFVEQQQYFFETLWNKAIPARQRIRELEEGAKREFVETIRDPSEIEKIGFDLIKKAEEEILILFSTTGVFRHQENAGVIKILREAALPPSNVRIRILTPAEEEKVVSRTTTANETILQLKELGIDVRRCAKQHQEQQNFLQNDMNNLMLMIVDQSLSLTVELNEDVTNEETSKEDAIGLATYSNTDPTVFAYTSIFENLWMRTEVQ
jgi:two-component system sensor histidine kinase VicK